MKIPQIAHRSVTPIDLKYPESGFYRDFKAIKAGVSSIKGSIDVKGEFAREVFLFIQPVLSGTQTSAATGHVHDVLSESSFANKESTIASIDGLSSLASSMLGKFGDVSKAIDPVVTGLTATSYMGVFRIPVNMPSDGKLSYNINTKGINSITALTAAGQLNLGLAVLSTDDLVGTPFKTFGQTFNSQTNQEFYVTNLKDQEAKAFEMIMLTDTDPAVLSNVSVGGDGSLGPDLLLLNESIDAAMLGNNIGQAPVSGSAVAVATGNASTYYVTKYRSKMPGLFGLNYTSQVSGAFAVKVAVPVSAV